MKEIEEKVQDVDMLHVLDLEAPEDTADITEKNVVDPDLEGNEMDEALEIDKIDVIDLRDVNGLNDAQRRIHHLEKGLNGFVNL